MLVVLAPEELLGADLLRPRRLGRPEAREPHLLTLLYAVLAVLPGAVDAAVPTEHRADGASRLTDCHLPIQDLPLQFLPAFGLNLVGVHHRLARHLGEISSLLDGGRRRRG